MGNYQAQNRQNYGNRSEGSGSTNSGATPTISKDSLEKIIVDGDVELLVNEAKDFSPKLVNPSWKESDRLSTSQIRAIFGEVRQIQGQLSVDFDKALRRLYLVKPKLAYRAKKENKEGVRALTTVLDQALDFVYAEKDKTNRKERFERFVQLFEAILAYHKGK
ncbi:MAG: type III-A CRISPR-associated protein Csm2 [Anaerolineae bacterium]|nr:type III-A CRISPR-associated protein Csm2 [Anaerolineae bacterium]